jgi:hypothetical protein
MNESSNEGNPSVEHAEQQLLGTTTYQKAEAVHKYADANPWLHPVLLVGGVLVIFVIFLLFKHKK